MNLKGKHFGEIEVVKEISRNRWLCKCSCGEEISATSSRLMNWSVTHCGCKSREKLEGKEFWNWEVLEYTGNGKYKCKCKLCDSIKEVDGHKVKTGESKSCGCWQLDDVKDKEFGDWKVIEYRGKGKWLCECKRCGTEREVDGYTLRNGTSKSCGCKEERDLTDLYFGLYHVIRKVDNQLWECECECGQRKNVRACNLISGGTKSCGCKTVEMYRKTMIEKYGELSIDRVDNPREEWQIEIIGDRNEIRGLIVWFTLEKRRKPRYWDIADILGVSNSTLIKYIKRYELETLFIEGTTYGSRFEEEISDMFSGADKHNREVLYGKELDLYYKDKNLAIEFNGSYWHSTEIKGKNYHRDKTIECLKRGVRLVHIFEYEWLNDKKKSKIINLLKNQLNPDIVRKLYARNTKVIEIDKDIATKFQDDYHLQGSVSASVNLGLYSGDELVGVMTFGKPRFNNSFKYELLRLVWKSNTIVVGGSNKIFKYFVNKYKPESIISYCDISKFTGRVYEALDFKFECYTEPNYVWVNKNKGEVLTRYQTMRHKLISKYNLGEDCSLTENEIMENLGFLKIYDSGNAKYVWKKGEQ